MQFPKSQVFEICLMEAVKNQPVLYDKDCTGYSNKHDIDCAWEQVLAEDSKKVKNINVTHCKLRWRSLRDRYVKQFIKTTNGAIVEPDLSKWAYNAQLNFLRKHLKKRKFSCEKTSSSKKLRAPQASKAMLKRIKSSSPDLQQQETIIVENITAAYNEPEHSCSESSSAAYEQDMQIEIDSLEGYDCPTEAEVEEVGEVEFVPFKPKPNIRKVEHTEVSNEMILNPFRKNVRTISNNEGQSQLQPIIMNESNTTTTSTEECINNLMQTVNNLLKAQHKKESQKSPNEEYLKVLDSLLKKMPPDELDKVKVDILNFVINKTKALQRRTLY